MAGAYGFALWFIEAPEVERPDMRPSAQVVMPSHDWEPGEQPAERPPQELAPLPGPADDTGWRPDVYTFLLTGEDVGGLTDVIMVVLFDTGNNSIDVLSIPRDTIVNVPWRVKRINSYRNMWRHAEAYRHHEHYIYALRDGVERLVGYQTDRWVVLELDGFAELVDAIGGVYFDVPQRMVYNDPYQGLFINLHPGYQRLTGEQAMGLVRFRRYPQGDIQRIRVQHDFLRALSSQLLQARNVWVLNDMVRIFRDNVDTDLTLRELLFFATEFLQVESEDIRFHSVDNTMANISENVNGVSYVSLRVEPWLAMINAYMSPFTFELQAEDLEILTRDPVTRQFFTTNGAPFSNNW